MSWSMLWPWTEKLFRSFPRFFRVLCCPAGNVNAEGSNTLSLVTSVVVVGPPAEAEGDPVGGVVVGEPAGVPPPQATPNRARATASTVMRASFIRTPSFGDVGPYR